MLDFDVVIVGSGAGGGMVAWLLASQGWSVALIEKGRNPYPTLGTDGFQGSLLGNDEVKHERFYAFQDPMIEPRTFRSSSTEEAARVHLQPLGVGVGGGTIFYDGDAPRLTDADMALHSTYGAVEGADVVDWPYGYRELEPYYDEAERLIGAQGRAGSDPIAETRGAYPMPPGYIRKASDILATGARSLGYSPHPMPMAVNSTFYRGRPACTDCGFCNVGCPVNAKGSTAVTVIHDALLTGNCTLLDECCVTEVLTEPSGERATGVRYVDPQGETQEITAKHIVIAANAIETPRILLESVSSAHADGLGNSSGLVGRYLMFHTICSAIASFDEEIRSYRGRPISQAMADFTVPDGNPDWVRGGYTELGGSIHPVSFGKELPWVVHGSLMLDGKMRKNISTVSMMGEDMPVADNRVELDPDTRDVYGRQAPRVTYGKHPHDQQMIDYFMPKMIDIAKASGASSVMEIDAAEQSGRPDTKHLMGTTRMGNDPATSVANEWGRLHDVANVWIADGSLWPTSTAYNPTLTQMAMALRTAAFMVDAENPLSALAASREASQ